MSIGLGELLGVRPGVTALIGSGGKTTALYRLAGELSRQGTVVCCTTTRIYRPRHLPVVEAGGGAALAAALRVHGCVCAGQPAAQGKLSCPEIPMGELAALADYVLVEADGAHGLPLKAHLSYEPVIPAEAGLTVLLVGASGFGRPAAEAAHRPEQFCRLAELGPEDPVTPEALARVLRREALAKTVLINQVESGEDLAAARALAGELEGRTFAAAIAKERWTCLL